MREDKQGCTFNEDSQYVELAAEVFSLLSDPTRIRIILLLRDGELPVGDLAERIGKSPTAVSQHLAKLRWGKIVRARQEGTRVFYSLIDEHARSLVTHAVFQAEHVVDGIPPHHLDESGSVEAAAVETVAESGSAAADATETGVTETADERPAGKA